MLADSILECTPTIYTDKLLSEYDVFFNKQTKIFTCGNFICYNNFSINKFYIYIHQNNVIFTKPFRNHGENNLLQRAIAIAVLMLDTNELHTSKDIEIISKHLDLLKGYISKHKVIFESYINKHKQIKNDTVAHYIPWHLGHDIMSQILMWGVTATSFKKLKVQTTCILFNKEQLLKIFEDVEYFKNEEESFVKSCTQNYMLYGTDESPKIYNNNFLLPLVDTIDNNTKTVSVFLKGDTLSRQCFNNYEFFSLVINFLIKREFTVKIFGYIKYNYEDKKYTHAIEKCEELGNKLIKNQKSEKIKFFNNITSEEFLKETCTSTHYITPPGTVQHIAHLFSLNLKKALVFGDINIPYFNTYKRYMKYFSLPMHFLEYYDLNGNILKDYKMRNAYQYNFSIKNLDELEEFFSENFEV